MSVTTLAINAMERGLVPTFALRAAIRRLLAIRLKEEYGSDSEAMHERFRALLTQLRESPVAISTAAANQQHYEVPTEFFKLCLGPRLKYSSGYWGPGVRTLGEAEQAMLELYACRADIHDGQDILDLGCGWGSLSLWLCEKFPNARIMAVSNSRTQRTYIESVARERGWNNLTVVTHDMQDFQPGRQFDRIVSVEMLEHMRNYQSLLERVAHWLAPGGRFLVHIFTHREAAYAFDAKGDDDWLARHFFTGGIMPSDHLLLYFQDHLRLMDHWRVDGRHYGRTARAWLSNLDAHAEGARRVLAEHLNLPARAPEVTRMVNRWRLFFLACEELWNYRNGREWMVSHYLFERRA